MADTRITHKDAAKTFILGGKAVFTIVSRKTGSRFTYRVRRATKATDAIYHVEVMSGHSAYDYIGTILPRKGFTQGSRSTLPAYDPRVMAFDWFWQIIGTTRDITIPETVEMWHVGKCARCSRPLTDPESIQSGFGPECRTKVQYAA